MGCPYFVKTFGVSVYEDGHRKVNGEGKRTGTRGPATRTETVPKVAIAMEQCRGTVKQNIDGTPVRFLQQIQAMTDAFKGVEVLRRIGLYHDDLKAANILIGSDGNGKIADLGIISRIDVQSATLHNRDLCTLGGTYPPPEAIHIRGLNQQLVSLTYQAKHALDSTTRQHAQDAIPAAKAALEAAYTAMDKTKLQVFSMGVTLANLLGRELRLPGLNQDYMCNHNNHKLTGRNPNEVIKYLADIHAALTSILDPSNTTYPPHIKGLAQLIFDCTQRESERPGTLEASARMEALRSAFEAEMGGAVIV
ncbi:hypothetical protein EBR96_01885 [bacterium]|nr:hypothetical protein [bacterium]